MIQKVDTHLGVNIILCSVNVYFFTDFMSLILLSKGDVGLVCAITVYFMVILCPSTLQLNTTIRKVDIEI